MSIDKFYASAGNVYRSTSFYVQKLFSQNRGDQYIPSTLPSSTGTVFWSVVRKTSTGQLIIKVILLLLKPTFTTSLTSVCRVDF